ncbi:hypothetical protein TNCT_137511 [Trichonephila clavata]|uniref:Essential MCU regulator, mitochondrial n=1 Tax=Trichonephila clavata TaxID=2740835 RepID=A0A8X6HU71_TRICU|nr:hypothetical protein TNCT_137511 [Trichonephila clavata]
MASHLMRLVRGVSKNNNAIEKLSVMPVRHAVTTDTGAMLPNPEKMPFGLFRVLLTVLPGLYLGATISKEGAAFLEENDIFVPDEDDDED